MSNTVKVHPVRGDDLTPALVWMLREFFLESHTEEPTKLTDDEREQLLSVKAAIGWGMPAAIAIHNEDWGGFVTIARDGSVAACWTFPAHRDGVVEGALRQWAVGHPLAVSPAA